MDCTVVMEDRDGGESRLYIKVLNAVDKGDTIVTGQTGIKVEPPERPRDKEGAFGFMQGGVSPEQPSVSTIKQIADAIRATKAEGGKMLAACGSALIHSDARGPRGPHRCGVRRMLSAGNGFAVHDLERDLHGTSLGMDTESFDHPHKEPTRNRERPKA